MLDDVHTLALKRDGYLPDKQFSSKKETNQF